MSNTITRRRSLTAKQLAEMNYGCATSCGPRQVSVLYTIFVLQSAGVPVSKESVIRSHPTVSKKSIETAFFTLKARRLIANNGRGVRLTQEGMKIANRVNNSHIAPGLGLVAVGVPART